MLTLADLTPQALAKIQSCQWDRIIEKHEGPEMWASTLRYYTPDFLEIAGHAVLLPISQTRHRNITVLRSIVSEDGNSLTVFLKDTTYCDGPDDEVFCAGFVAVCDRIQVEEFFVAVLYHEWFIIENMEAAQHGS